ncbi:MAG: hypothetical protein ABSF03_18130 [Streptosporangiaceae bacterium]|jgi:hypothetical protein
MKELTAADRAILDELDRQWGYLYDIAISDRKWIPRSSGSATSAPIRGRTAPSGSKWVAQRFGSQRWLTASHGGELAALIAADFTASSVLDPEAKTIEHAPGNTPHEGSPMTGEPCL